MTRWVTALWLWLLLGASGLRSGLLISRRTTTWRWRFYQAQRYEDAIPEFRPTSARPKPGLLFNLAQSYRKAGHPREAIEYYDRYLSSEPKNSTTRCGARWMAIWRKRATRWRRWSLR